MDPAPVVQAPTLWAALPWVGGALIAIVTTIGNSITAHVLKAKSERKQLRREKLEEIVTLVSSLSDWLTKDLECRMNDKDPPTCPLLRIKTLCRLHFHELESEMLGVSAATQRGRVYNIAAARSREAGGVTPTLTDEERQKELVESTGQLGMAENKFVEKAVELMRTI